MTVGVDRLVEHIRRKCSRGLKLACAVLATELLMRIGLGALAVLPAVYLKLHGERVVAVPEYVGGIATSSPRMDSVSKGLVPLATLQ